MNKPSMLNIGGGTMAANQVMKNPAGALRKDGLHSLNRRTLAAFIIMILAGSGTPIAIRLTYGEMPPLWSGAARFMLGALICWCLMFFLKLEMPKGKALIGSFLFGILSIGGAYILICWGLVKTTASLYQVLMALIPLLTLFLAAMHGLEPLTRHGLIGSFLAVVGISIAIGSISGIEIMIPRELAIIVAAGLMAEAGVVVKRFPQSHPIATSAVAMTVGSIILGGASLLIGERWMIPTQVKTWLGFGYLILISNLVSFLLFFFILKRWTASRTSFSFVVSPLVTVALATSLAGEQITVNFMLGGVLVLSGVLFGALLSTKPHVWMPEAGPLGSNETVYLNPPCS
jgi:drug/metabolite transporter (DMT)-like permease